MARTENRSPPARRDTRRLDKTGRQERGDEVVWSEKLAWIIRDTRIALRRKLNGDTR